MAAAFKMPQEPCPLPSLESDEESFVVLGQSIPDVSTEIYSEPIGLSVIAEAKRLINSELEAIEQTKNKSEEKISLDVNKDALDQNLPKMITSNLPTLPKLNKGFETSNTISITSFTSDMTSEEIQNKLSQLIDENIHLKDTILQNNMSLKSQYERIIAWQEDVQKVHQAHKDKLLEAKNFIESLKKEKENLKWELEKSKLVAFEFNKKNEDLAKLLEDKCSISNETLVQRSEDNVKAFQLDVANKKIKDLEHSVEKLTEENKKLLDEATQISKQEENSNNIISDLKTLLTKLTLENKQLTQEETKLKSQQNENGQKMTEVQSELKKVIEERDIAVKKVQELKDKMIMNTQLEEAQSRNSEEVVNLRTQLTETQTALTQIEYTRTQAYAQVSQLTNELSYLRSQLETLKSQAQEKSVEDSKSQDEFFALQTQLEVYKADFEEERRAREAIKSENDRLQEDLQHIQRRNQQLQEEIEVIRRESDYVVYPSAPPRSKESSSPKIKVKCPKCNFGFANVGDLEAHVNRCLDLDDNLP